MVFIDTKRIQQILQILDIGALRPIAVRFMHALLHIDNEPTAADNAPMDALISTLDTALRTLFATPHAQRPMPRPVDTFTPQGVDDTLPAAERALAGGLMRVNHVGEVCAQALYAAQALATNDPALKQQFAHAAAEETDHLAWTAQRLQALGARPSLLNPLWYAGAFGLGLVAGRLGDKVSLAFLVETERQVEAHLASHLEQLPMADHASRAVVAQMQRDEAQHAQAAQQAGAIELPLPVKALMGAAAKVMTTVAQRV
jgi:3-demethoxyubiquinol 3-hydroxylase